jgi:hypothetical protein
MSHTDHLSEVAEADVRALLKAEKHYGSSWKRRGGVGAFMMLARKWDRLEGALRPDDVREGCAAGSTGPWDIFGAVEADRREEGIIDDIRDLRRYLMLVESEMLARAHEEGLKVALERPVRSEERFPRNATRFEYGMLQKRTLRGGSLQGMHATELYRPATSGTVHPWSMLPEYVEEYCE